MTHTRNTRRWFSVFAAAAVLSLAPIQDSDRAHAGPSEDALKECLKYCAVGGLAWAAGCAAGYTIFGVTDSDTTPKFHFAAKPGFPWSPLGQDVLYYGYDEPAVLSAGLWKGCEPQCAAPIELVPGRNDVRGVTFSAVPLDAFLKAEYPDDEPWVSLGKARFNQKTNTWDLRVDPSTFRSENGYLLRSTFTDGKGNEALTFGLAYDASKVMRQ